MTDAELARLQALADAATPGPWAVVDEEGYGLGDFGEVNGLGGVRVVGGMSSEEYGGVFFLADTPFIAASREAIPALIAEVRRLREDNSDWGQLLNCLGPYIDWQRIGAVAAMSPTEREGFQRVLARMGQEVIDDD